MPANSSATESGTSRSSRAVERPVPLRQAVYDAISEMIVSRELQPGQHLRENELAAQLGVSRQPVREALQRLQNEGWVDLRPALGAFVHVPTEEEADQLLGVRALLEAESARLAARNATADDIEHLRGLQAAGERALAAQNAEDMVTANARLHAHIVQMSQNKVLAEHIGIIDRRVRWYYTPIARLRGRESWDEHAEIIETIADGKARKARDLMQRHTERTRTTYADQRNEEDQR